MSDIDLNGECIMEMRRILAEAGIPITAFADDMARLAAAEIERLRGEVASARAEGMREAARINQDLARKYHGVGQEAWATVLCDGADAILSAIGERQ